eukprot:Awhi_evm1s12880
MGNSRKATSSVNSGYDVNEEEDERLILNVEEELEVGEVRDTIAKLFVEFLGVFVLSFTVGLAAVAASFNQSSAILTPLAIGSTLMILVYCFGYV